jgi:hypothetical protein
MTVGLLEGLTSAIGDELTETGGFRTTRLVSPAATESRVQTGVDTASSVDGVTITFPLATLIPAVVAGLRFRLLSGVNTNESDIIFSKPDAQTLVLERGIPIGMPVSLSLLSWEVIVDADELITVETTLDWSASGEIFVDGVRYRYASKTLTTFDDLRPHRHLGLVGYITTVSGASLVDGETVTVDDGEGHIRTFELDSSDTIIYGNIRVPFTALSTANEVRDALILAINDIERLRVTASSGGTATVRLVHQTSGGTGRIDVVDTVAAVGFRTDGPRGLERDHTTGAEVTDYTRDSSSLDIYRRSFLVETAEGPDLDVVGRNVGVLRPPSLGNDEIFRELIKALAYAPRGTIFALELVLDALLGPGNYEIFEDLTLGSVNHTCTVYFRRTDNNELDPEGKTFLDGDERRPITNPTSVTLGQTPLRVGGLRITDENTERLIDFGTDASSIDNGETVTTPGAGQFSTNIKPGDILEITNGSIAGARGVVRIAGTATTQNLISLDASPGPLAGSPLLEIGANFSNLNWRVVRHVSNFRHYRPSEEVYLEYEGDTGTTIWTYTGSVPANEAANVIPVNSLTDGRYVALLDPLAAETVAYSHPARIHPESDATFELHMSTNGAALSVAAGSGLQVCFQMKDGLRTLGVGVIHVGGGIQDVGFIDATGTFIGTPGGQIDFTANAWNTFAIRKRGTDKVQLLQNGNVVQEEDYASFPVASTFELIFGCLSTTLAGAAMLVKQVDWSCSTSKDFWNAFADDGALTGSPSRRIDDIGALGLFLVSDVTNERRLRIRDFTVTNAAGGTPRGEWLIESFINADAVILNGVTHAESARTQGPFARRITITDDLFAFNYPESKGHQIVIENGPNMGTYTIDKFLDPVSFVDLDTLYPQTALIMPTVTAASGIPLITHTNIIEVDVDLPDPSSDFIADWHIEPVFAVDVGPVPYEIVDAGTVAGAVLTLRQALPYSAPFVVSASYSTVLSAQLLDGGDSNVEAPPGTFTFHPFYLADDFGFIRDVLKLCTVAGVIPDFDHLFRDDAGPHLLE